MSPSQAKHKHSRAASHCGQEPSTCICYFKSVRGRYLSDSTLLHNFYLKNELLQGGMKKFNSFPADSRRRASFAVSGHKMTYVRSLGKKRAIMQESPCPEQMPAYSQDPF